MYLAKCMSEKRWSDAIFLCFSEVEICLGGLISGRQNVLFKKVAKCMGVTMSGVGTCWAYHICKDPPRRPDVRYRSTV